ncbi:MAG: alpha/beta fold hydrolase [Gammaproteobacteria bacterium]|nr:alpha/beta fold hydrolase [Gammaproteobacteria bacterium]
MNAVEINPAGKVRASVIWLHGLGADGHDFEGLIPELGLTERGVRVVLPHADVRPMTLNGGAVMRAWYDLYGLDSNAVEDIEGIRASSRQLVEWIDNERERFDLSAEQVVVAGFSQGGALALHAGLGYAESLAGILALSTYLPDAEGIAVEGLKKNINVPLLMAHGMHDDVILVDIARQVRQYLKSLGYAVEWKEYDMAHAVSLAEIMDIRNWFNKVLQLI